jgi:hypothetical protein
MWLYFMAIWNILPQFGILYGILVYFVVIRYISPILVCCTMKNATTLQPPVAEPYQGNGIICLKGDLFHRKKIIKYSI